MLVTFKLNVIKEVSSNQSTSYLDIENVWESINPQEFGDGFADPKHTLRGSEKC